MDVLVPAHQHINSITKNTNEALHPYVLPNHLQRNHWYASTHIYYVSVDNLQYNAM